MRFRVGCLIPALVLLLAGCSGKQEEQTPQAKTPTIGVSLLTLTNPFFNDLGNAIESEAARQGYSVLIVSAEFDPARQRDQVRDFLVRRVAAILLTPADSRAIGTAIAEANDAGIPVFTADIACTAEGVQVVSHVASDNYQAGRLAAQALLEAIGGRGKIGIIDHPEVESVIMRTRGFQEALRDYIEKNGPMVEVVARLPGRGSKDIAFKVAEDMLQAHPDLAGIFAINDPSALGAVAAIEKAGKAGRIQVVGIDGQPEGRRAVRDGKIYADILQHPEQIGRQAVQVIARYLAGESVPPQILIPTSIYRRADALNDPSLTAGPGTEPAPDEHEPNEHRP